MVIGWSHRETLFYSVIDTANSEGNNARRRQFLMLLGPNGHQYKAVIMLQNDDSHKAIRGIASGYAGTGQIREV
jgi:hypothetical protein